ncbi:HAD-IIIA family hydrolase [Streptomyces sp. NPDC026673]|uniref:HAD family hydrolase n=1 Tax=Streptomyces sp. NPDC026673 TaxID=3155724 RepID=UPI0033E94C1B
MLLDFDGPICRVFARHPAPAVAKVLKRCMRAYAPLPPELDACIDPHALLSAVASNPAAYAPGLDKELHDLLTQEEVIAVASAVITEGLEAAVKSWREQGIRLGVVTNNAEECARAFLRHADLLDAFDGPIVGRPADARLMKPSGHMLRLALAELAMRPERCLFVGDSWRDAQAARSVGMRFVGYARNEQKWDELAAAGATTLISHMAAMEGMVW